MKHLAAAASLLLCLSIEVAAQERQWTFDQTDKDAYLVFGVPESDDVGLSFWCTQGSGDITMMVVKPDGTVRPGRKTPVRIEAGGKRFSFPGAATRDQDSGGITVELRTRTTDKLFAALAGADRMKVTIGKASETYPLLDLDFSPLLQLCAKP